MPASVSGEILREGAENGIAAGGTDEAGGVIEELVGETAEGAGVVVTATPGAGLLTPIVVTYAIPACIA